MKPLDILYYSLSIGFLVFVGFVSYAAYNLARTLQLVRKQLENVENLTEKIHIITNNMSTTINSMFKVIKFFTENRGDKNA